MSLDKHTKFLNNPKIFLSKKNIFLLLFLSLISQIFTQEKDSSQKQISKVNLLLPICQKSLCNNVYAKLIAFNGCYDWKADDPNLVSIEKIQKPGDPSNCFSEVYVFPKSKSTKEITYVSAKDRNSNEIFKCKVGFAEVNKISIENNFDYINIGDVFELHVLAHDEKGNIFSSLEGWKFNWKIISGHNNAQLIRLTEHGKIEVGSKREQIEKEGFQADKILIKGSQTGKILVGVEIIEDNLKDKILSNQRELYVIEPFKIIPDKDIYILPNTQYNFNLMYIHSKKLIPNSDHRYFKWSISDENCGKIKGFGYFYSKSIKCTVKAIAKDTRLEQFDTDEVQVHVLYPNNLDIRYLEITEEEKKNIEKMGIGNKLVDFNISPTFKLVEGKNYVFKNFLMYDDEPVYYDYKSVKFDFDLSNLYSYVHKGKINFKDYNELAFLLTDKVTLEDQTIQSSVTLDANNTLLIKKNVIIYEKVHIKKFGQKFFTLPYLGSSANNNQNSGQELYLIITGGTGRYVYHSSNPDIVDTVQDTYLISKNKGKANIKVYDNEMNTNMDEIDIYVKDVNSFTFMEERQEILKGNNFQVTPIALQQSKKYELENIFTNCSNINLNYDLSNHNLAQEDNKNGFNLNKLYRYYPIRDYINNNIDALTEKLNLINIKKDSEKYEYMNYSNFGICGSDSFITKEEGLLKILYKSVFDFQHNIKTINSINPAYINIYSQMEIKNIITDNFTKYLINKNKIENPDIEKSYILTEGSGVELNLIGGISPWNGYQNDFMEDKLVIEYNNNGNTYNADKVSKSFKFVNKKEKSIYAYCYRKGYEFDFIISVHNKKDISLIKPGESRVHFKLSCYNPDHLSMFLLSQTNNFIKTDDFILNEIFNEPQKEGIGYFVKKNSTDIVRIYAFDKNKKIFANITSLKGDFDRNKKNKNYFSILEREKIIANPHVYIKDKDIIENIYSLINQEFIQDYVLFNEIDEVSSDINNNYNHFELKYFLKSKISSQYANIQMIDVPEIYPQNASIYVRETNIYPLTIKKGSGDFSIELNDESLAKYNYDKNSRKLYITPMRQGILIIKVIDNQLGTGFNYETKSTLYLSDISRILLYGGGLLMNNKSTILGIEVYDSFENKFSPDQQKIIPLRLNESFYGLDYSFSKENTQINITGLVPGLYPIIIKDDYSQILSNIATIEVFEKLNVYPPYLLLVPGSEYTLEVTGGPKNKENVEIKYEILDSQIANVSSDYPKVYGAKYGETKLKISLIYKYDYDKIYNINDDKHIINKTDLLCVENVPVRVDFPDNVVIIGAENNRKIYSKSTIRLLAALKKGNEVFTYGIGPFKFEWKIDNPLIAKIKYFMRKELYNKSEKESKDEIDQNCEECETLSLISTNIDHNPQKSIGVFLTAIEEGIASISLTVSIYYPSPYTYHKPYQFTTSSKIIINDEVYVDLPGYYGNDLKKTGLYLIPYNVDHELHTNKNSEQMYSIIRQHDINDANNKNAKIISMTDNGRITSYFRNGLAYISISQLNNKDNNVPVILPILVSEFYSIFIEKTHTIIDMEVGQEMLLKIIIQHYNGVLFAEKFERLPLKAVVSHPDVANVELIDFNSKLKLKAQNIGDSNIILFHPDSRKIYDVFKLNVVQQTTLLNKIVISLGGNINFFGKDLSKKNELTKKGEWISDNPKILKVDKNGYGTAINEGEATVFLKEKNSQKIITSTRVLVRKISKVSFDKTKLPKSFSDIKKSGVEYISEYKVPVILYSNDDEIFTNDENDKLSIINQRIKIKCESDSPNYVKADEINKDNKHECSFIIRENKFGDSKKKSKEQKPKDIIIQLTVEDYYKNKNTIQESVPFSSSFKIKNNIHNINLSFRDREYTIYVDSLNDLDIKLNNDRLVKIEKIDKEKNSIKIKVPYSVDEDFKGVILYLANVLTGQKEEININYINTGLTGSNSGNSFSDFLFVIVLTCLLLLIGYFLLFSERKNPGQFMGNMSYNNFNNYNPNPSMMNMNMTGRGYPSSERRDFNNSNYMGNRYQNDDSGLRRNFNYNNNNNYMNTNNFSNNGSPGFNNIMRSNNNYLQHPRGSAFDRRFNESNLNLNNQY